jgi:hypothetical protein
MVFQIWLERLQDSNPAARIEALRVLAMVEETEALPVVGKVYKHDPDPAVREVAEWAGRLIWQAQQRGYSTASALSASAQPEATADHEESMLRSLEANMGDGRENPELRSRLEQDRLKREMVEVMRQRGIDVSKLTLADLAAAILSERE